MIKIIGNSVSIDNITDLPFFIGEVNFFYMFSLVRKVVAGPKNTTRFEGSELDLTYITERVIAMAFPASDLIEKTYRNPIEDVVSYFNERHPQNFLIMNVSSRHYDYSAFNGRVKDYEWPDHQAPPLTTLVQIAFEMYRYLKQSAQRVVAVHCNHGKGRTGTAIISFLLLVGYYQSAAECLKYYNSRRFNKDTYGVDQPCQLRYLQFVQKLVKSPKINPRIICYRLKGISQKGLNSDYFIKIQYTRNQSVIFEKVDFGFKMEQLSGNLLLADIFIEIYNSTWTGMKRIARINYNLYFCPENLQVTFSGKDIKLSDNHHSDFQITMHLQYYCLCHLPTYEQTVCNCKVERIIEEKYWNDTIQNIRQCKKITNKQLLFLVEGRKLKSPKNNKRPHDSEQKEKSIEASKSQVFRSMNNKKYKSSHKEKLASLVQNTIQKGMLEGSGQLVVVNQAPRIREFSNQIQQYENQPTVKIAKVEKVDFKELNE